MTGGHEYRRTGGQEDKTTLFSFGVKTFVLNLQIIFVFAYNYTAP